MHILVVHGPNLNMLGKRDPEKYGAKTLADIERELTRRATSLGVTLSFFQSNHEGAIIDFLQMNASRRADGVLINPGALVRYGYSLRQALVDLGKPVVEVHMSDIAKTGVNKSVNVLEDIRAHTISGLQEKSYYEGLSWLCTHISKQSQRSTP